MRLPVTLTIGLLVAALGVATPSPARADPPCRQDLGESQPVLLVHGFTDSAETWSSLQPDRISMVKTLTKPGLTVDTFDYRAVNRNWVTDKGIGQALADRITCLAKTSRDNGGPGEVIVVGHSMGGLATRQAADLMGPVAVTRDLGLVITIGTPNLGSFWRGGRARTAVQRAVVDVLNLGCQVHPGALGVRPLCALAAAMANSQAGLAFAPGSDELTALPPFPPGLPVRAIAGVVNEASVDLFGQRLFLPGAGDLVVDKASALAGAAVPELGGGPVEISCSGWVLPPRTVCDHFNQTKSAEVAEQVSIGIDTYLAEVDPYNATYSLTCGGESADPFSVRVTDGHGSADNPVTGGSYDVNVAAVSTGELTGNGRAETAVLLYCSPQPSNFFVSEAVVFLGRRPTHQIRLATLDPYEGLYPIPIYDPEEFVVRDGRLVTGIDDYDADDSHADPPSLHFVYEWRWNGSEFLPSQISGDSDQSPSLAEQAKALTGTWEGTYTCAQGLTGLRLFMTAQDTGAVSADFTFFAVPSNPAVPSGHFTMTGSHSAAELRLIEDRWVTRPDNSWLMVDLTAPLPLKASMDLQGQVTGSAPACTTFSMRKTSADATPTPVEQPEPPSGGPVDPAPRIAAVDTYTEGALVYVSLSFTDPDGDAQGFGFRGINGAGWAEENQTFTETSYGRVTPGRIDYPFNHACGTGSPVESDIEAWIYDAAGHRSEPVAVHLGCQ
ncbi:esterase/lipase family protein [Blastococcus deserti]|uniref:Esterase/lipase family protein n=1 Tax=Blastococcus deserti TaxID=2259033 RepID=A0ABW4X6Z7_9ACTN